MELNRKDRRKAASSKGKAAAERLPERSNFTAGETMELMEMQRMVNAERVKAQLVAGNTALIPRGQEVAKEIDAIARLLENNKDQWFSQKLREHGYPQDLKVQINLTTGEIVEVGQVEAAQKAPKKAKK